MSSPPGQPVIDCTIELSEVDAIGVDERFTYEHLSGWAGRPIDPAEFDLAFVNARLQAVQ